MLPELQKQFMDSVLRDNALIHEQLNTGIRDSKQQLSIYRHSYQGGLFKVMNDIYPVTARLLGDEFFEAMCLRYIKQTPCQSFDINQYSESFSEFATDFKPVSELVYLPDVIRLEWAWHRAYQTADPSAQDFTPLLGFSSSQLESIYLTLTPSMTLLTSPYPVDLIWSANQADQDGDENIKLDGRTRFLVIWRNGFDSHIDVIKSDLFEFLLSIQDNKILGAILESISNAEGHLVVCLQNGYFGSYHVQSSSEL